MNSRLSTDAPSRRPPVGRIVMTLLVVVGVATVVALGLSWFASPQPPAPTSLRAVKVTTSSVSLDWHAASAASAFEVQYSARPTMTDPRYRWFGRTTGTVSGLAWHRRYYFRVRAIGLLGSRSPYSSRRGHLSVVTRGLAVPPRGLRIALRHTKPTAHNTGAGVLRARPTRLASGADGSWNNGVLTIRKDLRNRVVNGTIKVAANHVVIENCIIRGDTLHKPGTSRLLVDTDGARGTVVRYNDIASSFASPYMNGIGHRNVVAEFNDVYHVTDGFAPLPAFGAANVHMVIRGNYVHDFQFFGNAPDHFPTPLMTAGGIRIQAPWAGKPWNHADAVQVEADRTTGLDVYGNNFNAKWADDSVSTLPLPNGVKELSVFMLNGGRHLVIADNWINGGEYAVNNANSKVTGRIIRNKFGRDMAHRGTSDAGYYALMIAAPGLHTYDATPDRNIWSDTGGVVPRRQN